MAFQRAHIRDFDKITNGALKEYLGRIFFRTAAYMMNNPDFIQALLAGLLKHAVMHVAKKCVDEVKKQQKQAAGCVGNTVQFAKNANILDFVGRASEIGRWPGYFM